MAFGQVSAAVLLSAEFFDYGFVWKLATVALRYNLPCFQQKNYIQFSLANFSCRFVIHCFLPLENSVTLKPCPVQMLLKSSQNQTETLKLMLVTAFDAESYSQHTLEIPDTVSKSREQKRQGWCTPMSLQLPTKDRKWGVERNGGFSEHRLPSFNCTCRLPATHRKENCCDSWTNNKDRVVFLHHFSILQCLHLDPSHLGYGCMYKR